MSRISLREHGKRARRRLLSISLLFLLWSVGLAFLLPSIFVFALLDLLRPMKSWARVRAYLSIFWILSCELVGIVVLVVVWLAYLAHRSERVFLRHNSAVQRGWTDALFAGCHRIYNLSVRTEGLEQASRGPVLLFVRHASLVDTVLSAAVFANRHRLRLRYVLKNELLHDPCIDIVANRLPNAFVSRGEDAAVDIARVKSLTESLGEDEGVLIYPEGTRFSPAKLARAKARLADNAEIGERVQSFQWLLPPRPGGALALLQSAPQVDLVFLAHKGLEGAASLRDFWQGELVGSQLRVYARRIPAGDIPPEARESIVWLMERWLEMDAWLSEA